jgi:hypothetical protein
VLRAPPWKPKQSGHALGIGNLPLNANIIDLKDHFSSGATQDIESLFLISKSRCTFANYRSEATCQTAMQRFHRSSFHSIRLICRLRKNLISGSSTDPNITNIAARRSFQSAPSQSEQEAHTEHNCEQVEADSDDTDGKVDAILNNEGYGGRTTVSERFFILQSLTRQDLDRALGLVFGLLNSRMKKYSTMRIR